jgi:hypothetical protein
MLYFVKRPGVPGRAIPRAAAVRRGALSRIQEHHMIASQNGVGFDALANEAEAARSTEGRWPRICELRCATGAETAGCAHVL